MARDVMKTSLSASKSFSDVRIGRQILFPLSDVYIQLHPAANVALMALHWLDKVSLLFHLNNSMAYA